MTLKLNPSLLLFSLYRRLPVVLSLALANTIARLRGSQVRFRREGKFFLAADPSGNRYFGSVPRGLIFYANGTEFRSRTLAEQYLISEMEPLSGSLIVDVGANYGDLGGMLGIRSENYVAIEPSTVEASCIALSFPRARVVRAAAGESKREMDLFVSSDYGDSSLIEPKIKPTHTEQVAVRPLDSILIELGLHEDEIFLLKVEAEGSEPEVLMGAHRTLERTKFVTIDGGPERGELEEETLSLCTKILSDSGFEPVRFNVRSRPGVGLFKNLRFES